MPFGLFFALTCFLSNSAVSQTSSPTIIVASEKELLTPTKQIRYFIDSTGSFTADQISTPEFDNKFSFQNSKIPNFKGVSGKVWFKFRIENQTSESTYLFLTNQYLHFIDVYSKADEEPLRILTQTGFSRPFATRGIESRNFLIKLTDPSDSVVNIYGSIRSPNGPFWISLKLGTLSAVTSENRLSEFISIAVLATMVAMLFYNFFIFCYLREKVYLFYVLYASATIVYFLFINSFLFEWFWPNRPSFNLSLFPLGFLYFSVILFVNTALGINRNDAPRLLQFSYVLYFLAAILALNGTILSLYSLFFVNLMSLVAPLYITIAVVHRLKTKSFFVYIFLIGWTPLLLMITLFTLMIEGAFYNEFLRVHGIELCTVWEAIIFSIALGYRYSALKKNVASLQEEKIRYMAEQNEQLERKVQQRTEEVTTQNEELIAQQEEITAQRDVIEIQKNSLEEKVKIRTLELAKSNNQLKIQLTKLNQFSFITAHNLRSPVARIMGLASIFDKQNPSNPVNTTILEKTSEAALDLDKVIHDLGFILQIQTDIPIEKSSIDLVELIESIKLKFEEEIAKTSATINVSLQKNILVTNKDYLNNILTNLISNSLKHRQSEKPAEITITFQELEAVYKLTVEDNGAGIDTDYFASKIFEPFQRFNDFTKGTGLGLYLVKTQVTNLGGRINLVSTLGKGTKVTIIIPKTTALL